jgi:hypothetical protein
MIKRSYKGKIVLSILTSLLILMVDIIKTSGLPTSISGEQTFFVYIIDSSSPFFLL